MEGPPSPSISAAHRGPIIGELWGDLAFIARDRTFYLVMAGVYAVPVAAEDLLENESLSINRRWSQSSLADAVFEPSDFVGNGIAPIGASVVLYGTGKLAHAPGLTAMASDLIRAQAINGLFTNIVKRSVNRTRPNGSRFSYPSGHTSSAFATAGVIAHYTGPTWGWVARGGAAMIALSRLQENVHYPSDLVAGAILGTYVAVAVTGRHRESTGIQLYPWLEGRNVGAQVSLSLP
jgi:membrane-associated phospholipid phosphatase